MLVKSLHHFVIRMTRFKRFYKPQGFGEFIQLKVAQGDVVEAVRFRPIKLDRQLEVDECGLIELASVEQETQVKGLVYALAQVIVIVPYPEGGLIDVHAFGVG